jgi:hypothetical protein
MKKTDLKRLLSNISDALEAAEEAAVYDAVIDLELAKDLIEARLNEEDAAEENEAEAAA